MDTDAIIWMIGAVCSAIVAVIGGIKVKSSAQDAQPTGDPNHQLVNVLARMSARLTHAETEIARLTHENASHQGQLTDQQHQITTLTRVVSAWESWYRLLIDQWHTLRHQDTPPAPPSHDPASVDRG